MTVGSTINLKYQSKPCKLSADRNQRNHLVQLTLFLLLSVFIKQKESVYNSSGFVYQ